ncbi:MAG: sugar phosphate isomerase/epimerase [Candidatus Sumerlaeota bacterium]|nr:sugar phosphate isomerase/epimerase [Candidatus Sumerlaeota bacterium]
MKPISLQMYSLREEAKKDFAGVLRQVAAMGYKGVEPAGFHNMTPPEFRKFVEDLGMKVSSTHGGWPTAENVNALIDTAKTIGATVTISGKGPDDFKILDAIKKVADSLNAVLPTFKAAGIGFGYHNHWWEFAKIDGRLGYDLLMEMCPGLLCQIDTYWAANFGAIDPAAVVAKYKARTPLLHIKDGPLVKDKAHTAVGSGKMNVPPLIAAADEKVLQWIVVELDSCDTDMTQAVADSYKYLVGKGLAAGNK